MEQYERLWVVSGGWVHLNGSSDVEQDGDKEERGVRSRVSDMPSASAVS